MKKNFIEQGQILIEMLLAILVAAIIIGAMASLVIVSQRSGQGSGTKSTAVSLAQEGMEAVSAIADSDWHNVYLPPDGTGSAANKGDLYPYYVYKNGSSWVLSANAANRDTIINGITYSRTVYIYNVSRNSAGDREIVAVGGTDDPSTQKIKIIVSYAGGPDTVISQYLARWENSVFAQADWSGGPGQAGPITSPNTLYFSDDGGIVNNNPAGSIKQASSAGVSQVFYSRTANAASPYPTTSDLYDTVAGTASNVATFAQNKKTAGFYQFKPGVTNTTSLGTTAASLPANPANLGWVYTGTTLSGKTTSAGNWTINLKYSVVYSSAPATKILWYRVLKVNCSGGTCIKAGNVSPTNALAPAGSGWSSFTLGALPASGVLSAMQTITFSASSVSWVSGDQVYAEFAIQTSTTGSNSGGWKIESETSSDKLATSAISGFPVSDYLISSTVDTGIAKGATLNSFIWKGNLNGGVVGLQLATSNCSGGQSNYPTCNTGAWGDSNTPYRGPDCTSLTSYQSLAGAPIEIMCVANHNNKRYYRYKVTLCSSDCSVAGSGSPEVQDVVIDWAP